MNNRSLANRKICSHESQWKIVFSRRFSNRLNEEAVKRKKISSTAIFADQLRCILLLLKQGKGQKYPFFIKSLKLKLNR